MTDAAHNTSPSLRLTDQMVHTQAHMIPVKGEIIHGSGNSTPAADFGAAAYVSCRRSGLKDGKHAWLARADEVIE
jgi:hypothetical protein